MKMPLAPLATRIEEAKMQMHLLQTGRAARVVVDQNGERVEFSMANIGQLRAYIADLEGQLNASAAPTAYGPVGFFF